MQGERQNEWARKWRTWKRIESNDQVSRFILQGCEKRERKRSVRVTRYDESKEEVLLGKNERFKMEAFLPILNPLTSDLKKRAEAYSLIGNLFSFFCEFKTISSDELKNMYEHLANVYHKNLGGDTL